MNGECTTNDISNPVSYARILGDRWVLYWEFKDDDKSIDFMVKYSWRGWWGMGLGRGMNGVDMIYGQ